MPEVQKFLQKFPNLKVASMKENDHAKPGGALFNKFRSAMMSLPTSQRNTCLAFHGTAESNIDSICTILAMTKRREVAKPMVPGSTSQHLPPFLSATARVERSYY